MFWYSFTLNGVTISMPPLSEVLRSFLLVLKVSSILGIYLFIYFFVSLLFPRSPLLKAALKSLKGNLS